VRPSTATLRRWLCCSLLPCGLAACQTAPPPPPHAEIVRSELTQILASQHPSCGAVRLHSRRDRLDYRVECASGQVYRVRVSADGRVLITPGEGP
jgi:hypothetical protein